MPKHIYTEVEATTETPDMAYEVVTPTDEDGNPLYAAVPAEGYAAMHKADLQAEVDRRNATRGETEQITPQSTKNADLIAALEADDNAEEK